MKLVTLIKTVRAVKIGLIVLAFILMLSIANGRSLSTNIIIGTLSFISTVAFYKLHTVQEDLIDKLYESNYKMDLNSKKG